MPHGPSNGSSSVLDEERRLLRSPFLWFVAALLLMSIGWWLASVLGERSDRQRTRGPALEAAPSTPASARPDELTVPR